MKIISEISMKNDKIPYTKDRIPKSFGSGIHHVEEIVLFRAQVEELKRCIKEQRISVACVRSYSTCGVEYDLGESCAMLAMSYSPPSPTKQVDSVGNY